MHRRRAMEHAITSVGLDEHKDMIAVAIAETGRLGEVREHGKIANIPTALKGLVSRLTLSGATLQFCYEAGPCGYRIQRQLTAAGHGCVVVAPSLIPRKPGDRIKTDRRDATNLAKLHRAGELTPVWVPDPAHEAIRDPACASGGGARPASSPSAIERLLAAPRPSLQPASLDTDPSTLAGRTEVRASGASHCAGGLHRGRRGGDGPARSSRSTHQGGATGVVTRAGGARVAGAARHGTGGGSDPELGDITRFANP